MANLGYTLSDQMVGNILQRHGVRGEFAVKPRWAADKVPYSGFANGSYPT
jgi:hypothetical protein